MRLTLRTLLAYLDNTLEAQDAEALKQKIAESGFATQLTQRIRTTVSRNVLPAASPHAVGPLDDPNAMSEFLDSTLPAEQVAEFERACLENDPLLAEAAACHQILTVILGQPAAVSDQLRERIYELPNQEAAKIAAAGSFSSLTIPPSGEAIGPDAAGTAESELPRSEKSPGTSAAATSATSAVTPVGVNDSGVSDAPTRLRQAEAAQQSKAEPAIAGSKPRSVDDTRIYGGSIRPSRITPWLVSLALLAVLLFALYQIFEPVLNRPQQLAEQTEGQAAADGVDNAEALSADEEALLAESEIQTESDADLDSPESTPEFDDVIIDNVVPEIDKAAENPRVVNGGQANQGQANQGQANEGEANQGEAEQGVEIIESLGPPPPPPGVDMEAMTPTPAVADASSEEAPASNGNPATAVEPDAADVADIAPPPPPGMENEAPATVVEVPEVDPTDPIAAVDAAANEVPAIATVSTEQTLLIAREDEKWVRLKAEETLTADQRFIVPTGFRVTLVTPQSEWSLVGPAAAQWVTDEDDQLTFDLEYGKLIIDPIEPGEVVTLTAAQENLRLEFGDNLEATAAVQLEFDRQPGLDPLVPENRVPAIEVYAIGDPIQIISNNDTMTIPAGQKWTRQGTAIADLQSLEVPPAWLQPTAEGQPSLPALAREGLLSLIKDAPSLQIALREATLFRRAEVAALAAQTLLQIGFGDVYFGGDGILSEIKQRIYWPEHYRALIDHTNRSADAAAALRASIVKMDSANASSIFRLLTSFSQKQLVEGADEELVAMLDSPSTAVRVLALENLREITGTTLNFRPEENNDVRRASGVRKWEVRQRKGDIRWQP